MTSDPASAAIGTAADVGADLARSAALEWSLLVTTAVLGTQRRPLPAAPPGWEPVARFGPGRDDAAALLDRAAAAAAARRAGVRPSPAPAPMQPAPADPRPSCPALVAGHLAQMLQGVHDILLAEWFLLCARSNRRPPFQLVPALLVRGRRDPSFDGVARGLIGPRAAWLAAAVPELGVAVGSPGATVGSAPLLPPARPPDSAAAVSAIVATFLHRRATWAAAAELRLAVASLDPSWLPALIGELQRCPFDAVTERTRTELVSLAETRREIVVGFAEGGD